MVLDFPLPVLERSRMRWPGPQAVVSLYLTFLARFMDTHIQRKLGSVAAQRVQREARRFVEGLEASASSELDVEDLMRFDCSLKSRRINPGTSADLTVATLLTGHLLREGANRVAARPARDAAGMETM